MTRLRYLLVLMLLLVLAAHMPGWAVREAGAAAEEKSPAVTAVQEEGEKECKEEAKEDEPPGTFGPILTDTAVPVDVGALELQPFWSFGFVTGTFNDRARRVSAGGNFYSFGFDLQVTYGAWNNLEVFTVIPVVVNWANSVSVYSGRSGS